MSAEPVGITLPAKVPSADGAAAAKLNAQGVELKLAGKLDQAIACYREASLLLPQSAAIWTNLGNTLLAQGDVVEAVRSLRRAFSLDPQDTRFRQNLAVALNAEGVTLRKAGRTEDAIAIYREALTLVSDRAAIWSNLGNALSDLNRNALAAAANPEPGDTGPATPPKDLKPFEDAVECHRRAVALEPDQPVLRDNLGVALNALGTALRAKRQAKVAAAIYREVIGLFPDKGWGWSNLGNALKDMKLLTSAVACHHHANALEPNSAGFQFNLAVTLAAANRSAEAITVLDQALALRPNDPHMRWDRGLNALKLGQYEQGWLDYEARFETGKLPTRDLPGKRWRGEPYPGQTLLLASEQGFGDGIWTARYLRRVKELGGRLVVEARKELVPLIGEMGVADLVIEKGAKPPAADWQAHICSLPGLYAPTLSAVSGAPYLVADPRRRQRFRALFAEAGTALKVGIVWSGSTTFKANHDRAVPLRLFLESLALPGGQLYSLQKGPPVAELRSIQKAPMIDLAPHMADFADTAAAVAELDLVIMTDSAVAHLAGALGKPVWVLLNHGAYWLWLEDRQQSPWYDSMKLFRASVWGDWTGVFDAATAELLRLVIERQAGGTGKPAGTAS